MEGKKKHRQSIRDMLDSPLYLVVMTSLVLFSVFAWDLSRGWLGSGVDRVVESVMTVLFFVFIIEIFLMIYSTRRWWTEFSIWLFVFATAMMTFEIPWIESYIFDTTTSVGALASLRLIKVFRTLARLGRVLRIIKSLVLSDLRSFVSAVVRRNVDADSRRRSQVARRTIRVEARKKSYDVLERATTFAVVTIFTVMYLAATLLVSSINRDESLDRAFESIAGDSRATEESVRLLLNSYDEIVFLSVEGTVYADRRADVRTYRDAEIVVARHQGSTLWIDIREFARKGARREAMLTLSFIVAISYLIVVFNWLISRFAVRLSGALNTLTRSVEERDAYTKMHSKNVASMAEKVARHMHLSKQEQLVTRIAGELHDIGMIGVPHDLIRKREELSAAEHDLMKRHAEEGAGILHHLIDFEAVIQAARHHHERFDGSGYPDGLSGQEIPRTASLVAVCDVWDALTTDRPYRPAFDDERAKQTLIDGKGTQFDPEVVDAFLRVIVEEQESKSASG